MVPYRDPFNDDVNGRELGEYLKSIDISRTNFIPYFRFTFSRRIARFSTVTIDTGTSRIIPNRNFGEASLRYINPSIFGNLIQLRRSNFLRDSVEAFGGGRLTRGIIRREPPRAASRRTGRTKVMQTTGHDPALTRTETFLRPVRNIVPSARISSFVPASHRREISPWDQKGLS